MIKISEEFSDNYSKTVFDNGLTIVSEFVSAVGSFAAGICINIGSRNDTNGKEGIAHFMEHAAFKHTKNRNTRQIANEFETLGAYSNAFTTKELTCFYVRAIKEHFAKTFELLTDITLNTVFFEAEIARETAIIIEEIKSYEDDPEEFISDLADTVVFAGSPLAAPILGTQQSVENINCGDLQMFHSENYQPKNITISLAGNIEHSTVIELAQKFFNRNSDNNNNNLATVNKNSNNFIKKIDPKVANSKDFRNLSLQNQPQNLQIHKPIQQAHIIIGKLTNGIRHSERYPLALLSTLFGDGMSSRLYQNLREKHGLAYSIYSVLQNYTDCGAIYLYAATDENKHQKTIDLIFDEMKKLISTKKTSQKELNRAKEQLKTASIIELESMSSRMQNLLKQEVSLQKSETIHDIINSIDKISLDEIIALSEEYFCPENWNICSLLPQINA